MENMKNVIEIPTEKDFHKTKNVEVTTDQTNGLSKVHYRNCNINMRSVMDFTSIELDIEVADETKMEDFKLKLAEYTKKHGYNEFNFPQAVRVSETEVEKAPEYPIKNVKITGTLVMYYTGVHRVIVDDFNEFESKYFTHLQALRLDIEN